MGRLAGKTALVTGAARGIGAAIARAFIAEGARVWLTDIDVPGGTAAATALGPAATFHRLDVREETDWRATVETLLGSGGRLDCVVNNAGITGLENGGAHDPEHASLDSWRAVMATTLDGVFLGCRYGLRAMRRHGTGTIINVASRSGRVGVPRAAAYAAAKAAVLNHTRSVALYCAEEGLPVRCNAIVPGAILTPMWEPMLGDGPAREAAMAGLVADVPLQRFGQPEEVAAIAVLLASDEAPYVTGTEIAIDGGLLAGTAAAPKPADT